MDVVMRMWSGTRALQGTMYHTRVRSWRAQLCPVPATVSSVDQSLLDSNLSILSLV